MAQRIVRIAFLWVGAALVLLSACTSSQNGGGKRALSEIERGHEIKIAVHPYNIPFEFGLATSVQGIGAEVGEEIAKSLKVRTTWMKMESFDQIFTLVEKGDAQMAISSISVTEDRKKAGFLFSKPYYPDSGQIIVIRTSDKTIKNLAGLGGKKVGVQENTTGQKFLESQNIPGAQIEKFRTHDDALLKLASGEIDAFIGDKPIVSYIIFKSFPERLQTVGDLLTHEPYAVMAKDPDLLKVINESIDRMEKSGKLKEIVKSKFEDLKLWEAKQQRDREALERAKTAPKTVNFVLTSTKFPMERLDGHQIHLSGESRSFTSSHITSTGKTGRCSIGGVPPGQYQAMLEVLKFKTTVTVPADLSKSVTINLTF
ncbi:MAG: amino acid ABC transporter substrate-binding protein [Acidobacteria bacterium]|nr:amino acid ABC transporter substrate-binding protein [Acidobacteriota bacterium]MBI3658525.1 amino acid ABC transporter substrate-binding protein [Acidobacteriota bacterium]